MQDAAERTRPLTAGEHALLAAARTEADQARQQAENASEPAQAARSELAEVRDALQRSTAVTGQASEQIRLLRQELEQARCDAEATVEQVRRGAELAITQVRREAQAEVDIARHEAELVIAAARTQPALSGHHGYATVPAAGSARASVTSLVPAPAGEQASADSVALPATAPARFERAASAVGAGHSDPAELRG